LVGKVDIVIWTKNGALTLARVLRRISEVIPQKHVHEKLIIDDGSTDNTREIAESFGWSVILNEGKGISDGANTALKHVTTEWFISFEQDLLLARDWWDKVPKALEDLKVAIASGMRFANNPIGIRRTQQYVARKYRGKAELESWLKGREMAAFTLGKTLDNTIYKTEVVKAVGGFPKLKSSSGVDTILAYLIDQAGYRWFVDYNVQSVHFRRGLKQELEHQYWYARQLSEIWKKIESETNKRPPVTKLSVISRFVISPFTGLFMAYKTREATIAYIHPLLRFYYLKGLLKSGN